MSEEMINGYRWVDDMKKCSLCKIAKGKDEYPPKPQAWCRECLSTNTLRAELVDKYEGQPCADCGKVFPWECMDWDHVRGKKIYTISALAQQRSDNAREKLYIEIAKCELVCACCHRTRTRRSDRPHPTRGKQRRI